MGVLRCVCSDGFYVAVYLIALCFSDNNICWCREWCDSKHWLLALFRKMVAEVKTTTKKQGNEQVSEQVTLFCYLVSFSPVILADN